MSSRATAELLRDLEAAESKAWDALARYKFMMFGYWAAIWVHQNRVGGFKRQSPFKSLVMLARAREPARKSTPRSPLFEEAA